MRIFLLFTAIAAAAIYLWNASWLVARPAEPAIRLIAHRGVHQTFDRQGIDRQSCTAERIHPPEHPFLENTIPSIRAAFEAGADVVEIDVHPTTDGRFAVFHDWTLDCRTEGLGVTRERSLVYLKTLDVGYGYTADGGATYPLRGTGVGLMPSLEEVFEAFPEGRFLIDYKSPDAREGDMLAELLADRPQWRDNVWGVYGGDAPTGRAVSLIADLKGVGARQARTCLLRYLALGWTGYVPEACRNTFVMVPGNVTWLMWGWPHRFHARMKAAGSDIILAGPYRWGDAGGSGIDALEALTLIPDGFDGYVWTDRIEVIAPALAER